MVASCWTLLTLINDARTHEHKIYIYYILIYNPDFYLASAYTREIQ